MRKLHHLLICTSFLIFSIGSNVHAVQDEETFISLTREPMPVSKLPTNISVLNAQQIKDSGANTLAEVLDILPAVDVNHSGEMGTLSTVRLRGTPTSNQVQILVDDQPLGGVSIQDINLGLIPVDNIERIEVVRGSSPMLYGANTIGGVIHIITKKPSTPEVELGYEARSFSTQIEKARVGGAAGNLKYFVTGNHYETEGYMKHANVNDTNVTSAFDYGFANGANVGLAADFTDHDLESPNGTSVPFDQWNGDREREPNSTTQRVHNGLTKVRVKGETPLGRAVNLKSTIYNSNEEYKLFLTRDSAPLTTYDKTITGADAHLVFVNGLVFGGAYERDGYDALDQNPHHATNWAVYGQDEINVSKLSLLPALRFDQHGTFGNQLNPRLTAIFRAMESWKISANAARSYRAPQLVDLYIVSEDPFFPAFNFYGNPNLQPETAWTYDLGTEVRPTSNTRMSLTGYYTRIQDRIAAVDTDGNGNNDTYTNAGEAELSGAEVEIFAKTGFLSHDLNGTYQRAIGSSATQSRMVRLRLTPRYLANYRLVAASSFGLRFVNTLQYTDHQFQNDDGQGKKLSSYLLWNVRLEQSINGVTMFAGVNNVSDNIYADSFTFGNQTPQATRTYVGGASLTFR